MMSKTSISGIALRLIIITAVAGLLLGLTFNITSGPIAEQELLAKSRARTAVLPEADDFTEVDLPSLGIDTEKYGEVTEAYIGTKGGQPVGATVTINTKGYSSGLQVTVGLDTGGVITGVSIDSHSETPGLGAKADDEVYLAQYTGVSAPFDVVKTNPSSDNEIQAVTGATLTSKGVAGAVNTASALYLEYLCEEGL